MTAHPRMHLKRYPDGSARHRAEQNYRWLASLPSSFRLPRLLLAEGEWMGFEHIAGRHAQPGDLTALAYHLGRAHAAANSTTLRNASLAAGLRTATGHRIPGFPGRRLTAVARELESGRVPSPAFTISHAQALLIEACAGPAAFYKDANPRNFLITADGPVLVDFDELTLAPFGYDLAKLVVTLAMTHGPLPAPLIASALHTYNTATGHLPGLTPLTWAELMSWADIHHILTSRYHGRSGYRHRWPDLRPASPPAEGTR
jgi:aminoglycoside phosphotransferase (APT) family kinase protein